MAQMNSYQQLFLGVAVLLTANTDGNVDIDNTRPTPID
ncbi:hypothetical protein WDC_0612 [Paucilactobacillus wasatchensis]|uniref:Uncharacterized protein n=1 Tax=Paucilactobacillus wasatchensis TaxID=1335616 RepID=A0A0D1A7B8_9LACO|nr:hypothetical protein WDC_0612 [Paucilactobacillus wasatchensis]